MALSPTGKLTFRIRLTFATDNHTSTHTVTVPETNGCDQVARAIVLASLPLGGANVDFCEIWLIAADAT